MPDLASEQLQAAVRLLPPEEVPSAQALLRQIQEPERWLRLGDLLMSHGEYEAAANAYDHAAALGAPLADAAAGLGSALIALEAWEDAAQVLNQEIEAAPNDARICNNLGVVARETGNVEQARHLFAKAVELAPDWDLPQKNLEALPKP